MRSNESICVWGDFDVDGQTSTTLLVQTLQAIGANITHYIPIRGKESHGVHIESLKPIIDNGAKLIITCDTGITAYEAIDYANSRGVDVVVTDHHDLGDTLPNAKAIINPKLLSTDHLLANLAGVGVAYKLAEALLIKNRKSEIENITGSRCPRSHRRRCAPQRRNAFARAKRNSSITKHKSSRIESDGRTRRGKSRNID